MKRLTVHVLILPIILWASLGWGAATLETPKVPEVTIQVFFSPSGGCTEAVVEALGQAKTDVKVQAYAFTSTQIQKALVDAHKRGVRVEVILDKSQRTEKYSAADFLAHAGIPTRIDPQHKLAHNSIMVIDAGVVITGSFNFTEAAEHDNAENLLVIRSRGLAARYAESWDAHAVHSEPYTGRGR